MRTGGSEADIAGVAYFERLMEHAHWANARVLDALRESPGDARPLALFAHVLTTEAIYHARMSGRDPWPQDFWPELGLDRCAELVTANRALYRSFLRSLTDDGLEEPMRYRNSRGEVYDTRLADLLTHVALHGAYHRGQIALSLRAAGAEPPVTDFIACARETG